MSFSNIFQDIKVAVRMLSRNPGFTVVAILTLALGIGANTALFTVFNGVLLNPLPLWQADRLTILFEINHGFRHASISYPNFLDWQAGNRSFESMAAYRSDNATLTGAGEPDHLRVKMISSQFFPTLHIQPLLGRNIRAEEDRFGGDPVVQLTEGLWRQKFAAARDIVGRHITLDGRDYNVIGVIPASFHLQMWNFGESDLFIPIGQWNDYLFRARDISPGIDAVARLKPGVSLAQAQTDMNSIAANLALEYPIADKGVGSNVAPLKGEIVSSVRPILLLLLGAVGFVLLIACVNVANLLLARATNRSQEFAVRAALGASRSRMLQQLLTESVLLSLAGGALGVLAASWGTDFALHNLPNSLPRSEDVSLDSRVLLFSLAASLVAGILFGLVPALRATRSDLQTSLRSGTRGSTRARHRTHGIFVVVEVALAIVLLVGAGLMVRSLAGLWKANPGFDSHNVLTFGMAPPVSLRAQSSDAIRASLVETASKLGSIPGVQAVALERGSLPLQSDSEDPFYIEGRPKPSALKDMPWALLYEAGPNYLKVMGIPLLQGRFFTDQDDIHSPLVAVIDEAFVSSQFKGQNPIGQVVVDEYMGAAHVVGVVGHVKQFGIVDNSPIQGQLYFPVSQISDKLLARVAKGSVVVLRSALPPSTLLPEIRNSLASVEGQPVIFDVQSMDDMISKSLASERFAMELLAAFSIMAIILASVGLYGVISYLVGQRTHEIGIRMALGARQSDVLRLVVGSGARMALAGVAIGLVAALMLTRLLRNLVYGVSTTDPATFMAVAAILLVIGLAASYIPARRASRVDPLVALRHD